MERVDQNEYSITYKPFEKIYFDTREFHISRYARDIRDTANLSQNFTSVRKVVLVGDINQNSRLTLDLYMNSVTASRRA